MKRHFLNMVHYVVTQSLSEARLQSDVHQLHASHSVYSKWIAIAPYRTHFEEYYVYYLSSPDTHCEFFTRREH